MTLGARFKSVDFYRKIPRDLTEATLSGAGISIIAAVILAFLVGMEFSAYLNVQSKTEVSLKTQGFLVSLQ